MKRRRAAVRASAQPRANNDLFPMRDGKKFGYINRTGAVVVPPQYDAAAEPASQTGTLSGYIDLSGKVAIEPKYEGRRIPGIPAPLPATIPSTRS